MLVGWWCFVEAWYLIQIFFKIPSMGQRRYTWHVRKLSGPEQVAGGLLAQQCRDSTHSSGSSLAVWSMERLRQGVGADDMGETNVESRSPYRQEVCAWTVEPSRRILKGPEQETFTPCHWWKMAAVPREEDICSTDSSPSSWKYSCISQRSEKLH